MKAATLHDSIRKKESRVRYLCNGIRQVKGAAATTAAAAAGTVAAAPASASSGFGMVVDMTHTLHENFPTYFGTPQFSMEQKFNYKKHYFNLFEFTVNEHTGTHLDAPLHFSEDGMSVDEIAARRSEFDLECGWPPQIWCFRVR
ncbi:MAG: cyclase family protein, partial [Caldilineaceae bacterium]|nr:cyclase family protein [Caldilineaceae bacterium]